MESIEHAVLYCGAVYYTVRSSCYVSVYGYIPFNIKQYFHVVLFIMLYKVVLTFESVVLKCDHSTESC